MRRLKFLLGAMLAILILVAGCESKTADETKKEGEAKEEKAAGAETALMAPAGSPGSMENNEGVGHYEQGHWDVSEVHFRKSIELDPGLAVGHFNLALALDKLGKHGEATEHFKQAAGLAPNNAQIAQSKILKAHTGM